MVFLVNYSLSVAGQKENEMGVKAEYFRNPPEICTRGIVDPLFQFDGIFDLLLITWHTSLFK